jgi:hypothetical protein
MTAKLNSLAALEQQPETREETALAQEEALPIDLSEFEPPTPQTSSPESPEEELSVVRSLSESPEEELSVVVPSLPESPEEELSVLPSPPESPEEELSAPPSSPAVPPHQELPSPVLATPAEEPSREIQWLWFAVQRFPWSSLALVPVSPGRSCRKLAQVLVKVASLESSGSPVSLIDAAGVELNDLSSLSAKVASGVAGGRRTVILADPVTHDPAAVPVARRADAVLLCIELGRAQVADAQRAVELIGRERIIGCVAIHPEAQP